MVPRYFNNVIIAPAEIKLIIISQRARTNVPCKVPRNAHSHPALGRLWDKIFETLQVIVTLLLSKGRMLQILVEFHSH